MIDGKENEIVRRLNYINAEANKEEFKTFIYLDLLHRHGVISAKYFEMRIRQIANSIKKRQEGEIKHEQITETT